MDPKDAKPALAERLFRLADPLSHIAASDAIWASFWTLPRSVNDVFTAFSPANIVLLRDTNPRNFFLLIRLTATRLVSLARQAESGTFNKSEALNCARLLTRLLPYLYEKAELASAEKTLFWSLNNTVDPHTQASGSSNGDHQRIGRRAGQPRQNDRQSLDEARRGRVAERLASAGRPAGAASGQSAIYHRLHRRGGGQTKPAEFHRVLDLGAWNWTRRQAQAPRHDSRLQQTRDSASIAGPLLAMSLQTGLERGTARKPVPDGAGDGGAQTADAHADLVAAEPGMSVHEGSERVQHGAGSGDRGAERGAYFDGHERDAAVHADDCVPAAQDGPGLSAQTGHSDRHAREPGAVLLRPAAQGAGARVSGRGPGQAAFPADGRQFWCCSQRFWSLVPHQGEVSGRVIQS
ncbi:hypothetical protein KL933_000300 [Ogataea haglerorum]|uniref:Uncharacterized protein n=1 Tax=Ogataea haglerorum TaxID=1937702 RepID=A0AAN6I2E7_9ASCO|nr:hypothetical protein KL933_000300 [Ogataea haglerorum]